MARSAQTARKRTCIVKIKKNTETGEKKDKNAWTKQNAPYDIIVKENALFEKYYRQLNLVEDKEFDDMMHVLTLPLPITFRITSYKSFSKEILNILKEKHFKYLDQITKEDNGELVASGGSKGSSYLLAKKNENSEIAANNGEIYKCLSWYPNEMAWQVLLSRSDVRKNVHFEEFKKFLMHQTNNGNINRQEAVSMIPPLLLDAQPHHKILDMCASPGSKTAQLIEFLHQDPNNPTPEGFVIANDLDNKRCYMLMHQLKRLESPNFMIINHDASALPNLRAESADNTHVNIMYDRILADVPCSGDGTFRKNIDVWTKWNFAHACNLHGIQSRIANRAAELLKPGGIMVYSTCSFNPVENEAVVANLLLKEEFKGQLELIESRHKLPGLKTVNGLLKWNLMDKNGEIYQNIEEVSKTKFGNLLKPYMFPPELSVAKELNLDRCIRVLPHHQNTGGFFIAVIRKKGKEENEPVKESPPEADESRVMKAPAAKRQRFGYEENPFKFIDENCTSIKDWPKIKEFFQISDDFPVSQMMTRNKKGENIRSIYFVSKQIKQLTVNNADRIKFINMGVPLFTRADSKDANNIDLRISQESCDIVQKYFKSRVVQITDLSDLTKILKESTPALIGLTVQLQEEIKEKSQNTGGNLILVYKKQLIKSEVDKEANELPISFTAWLGKATLRPLINVDARKFFLEIIGVEQASIEEACNKIKEEDQINSKKSLETNPISQFYKGNLEVTEEDRQETVNANE